MHRMRLLVPLITHYSLLITQLYPLSPNRKYSQNYLASPLAYLCYNFGVILSSMQLKAACDSLLEHRL